MVIFAGFLIELGSVFVWLSWIQWISAVRYALTVLVVNEFNKDITFCLANSTSTCPLTGLDVLDMQGLAHNTSWDLWKYFFALCMMACTFLLLAYIQMVRIKKTK